MKVDVIEKIYPSLVKIIDPYRDPYNNFRGTGFFIHPSGYIITCYHVIIDMSLIKVEWNNNTYPTYYCEDLSDPEVDVAVLWVDVKDAPYIPIVNPPEFQNNMVKSVIYGYPIQKSHIFPNGFVQHPKNIMPAAPIRTLAAINKNNFGIGELWNLPPSPDSTYSSYEINEKVYAGMSGSPVYIPSLEGVIGIIQSIDKNENKSYAIRTENIIGKLKKIGVKPVKHGFLSKRKPPFLIRLLLRSRRFNAIIDAAMGIIFESEKDYQYALWHYEAAAHQFRPGKCKNWAQRKVNDNLGILRDIRLRLEYPHYYK